MRALGFLSIGWSIFGCVNMLFGKDSNFPLLMGAIFLVGDCVVGAIARRGAQ